MEEYKVDISKIENQISEWAGRYLKSGFMFRKHQKEAIANIIDRIVNNTNKNIIIEAPTGTGKSLINIISAEVLWEYYHIDSYILCSDLYLFDQYEKFVEENPQIENLASIKGQTGNYKCKANGEDIRLAECQMSGVSWSSLIRRDPHVMSKGFNCCKNCKYVKCRERAIKSPVTITTYQNFLYQINIVFAQRQAQDNENISTSFGPRKVIFCDEAHNIPDIIRLKYTPEIHYSDINKLIDIVNYYEKIKTSAEWQSFINSFNDEQHLVFTQVEQNVDENIKHVNIKNTIKLKDEFDKIWAVFVTPNPSKDDLIEAILDYQRMCNQIANIAKIIGFWVIYHKRNKYDKLSTDMFNIWRTTVWLFNYCCSYNDFNSAWNNEYTGPKYILKQIAGEQTNRYPNKTLFDELTQMDNRIVSFNCTKEDYLIYIGLLSWAEFRVFTSATIGGKDNFSENNGIEYTEDGYASFDRIPTIFDFTKSPINFLNRYSMSFKERNTSLPKICKMVQKLCERHKNEKGIIQTGSYAITKELINSLNKETQERLLTYNGSREKIKMAEIHKRSQNTILVGPSLNQGIDLPDDNVRFIIILKVPYPSLTDEYVKEKIKLFPKWYEAVTTTEIIQGIGRGVRNENDWCITYILDSCFYKLYLNTMDQFSDELRDRLKIFN